MAEMRYRPEIDGLRALAVVPVVMFHLGLGCPGGFVGVDVFFVISGFLITGIIQRGLEKQTFSLAEFWERRIRRIFPALLVVLVATLVAGYWLLLPNELEALGKSSVAQALLLANVYFWRDTGYFSGQSELKPLLHTWSLAVEEQFYLVFPLVLCWLRRLSRQKLFSLLAIAALLSFAASVYGSLFHAEATFFLLPTRAWELLVGCMLAVSPWHGKPSPLRDRVLATLGVAAIALPVFLYDAETPFPGLAAAPPVLGTAAIIFATANTPTVWVGRVLSFRPLVWIGLISYSLYLWHWPIIVYARMWFGSFGWPQMFFATTTSVLCAVVSWKFVESPLRQKTYLSERRKLLVAALASSGAVIAISVWLIGTHGCQWRFPSNLALLQEDVEWAGFEYSAKLGSDRQLRIPDLPSLGVEMTAPDERLDFLVWGDSFGMALCDVINSVAADRHLRGKALVDSMFLPVPNVEVIQDEGAMRFGDHLRHRTRVMELLATARPRNLILVAAWAAYDGDHGNSLAETRANSVSGGSIDILERNLRYLNAFCVDHGITLWVVKEVPRTGELAPANTLLRYVAGRTPHLSNQRRTKADYDELVASVDPMFHVLREDAVVRVIDPTPLLFDDQQMTRNYLEGRAVYRDSSHLTRWGGQHVRPVFETMFARIQRQAGSETSAGDVSP